MYTDNNLLFSDAQSVTTAPGAWSTNKVDLRNIRDVGAGNPLKVRVTQDASLTISSSAPAVTDAVILDIGVYASSVDLTTDSGTSVTCTSASPGVVTWTAHGLVTGDPVVFTGGTAPTGLALNTIYYINRTGANTFTLSATPGGTAINTSSTGSALFMAALRPLGATGPVNAYTAENSRKMGFVIPIHEIPTDLGLRYLAVRYGVTGSNLASTWNAVLVVDSQDGRKFYASGYTIS